MKNPYKIVRRKSLFGFGNVFVLQLRAKPNTYKEIAFGERAEFDKLKDAIKYIKEIQKEVIFDRRGIKGLFKK